MRSLVYRYIAMVILFWGSSAVLMGQDMLYTQYFNAPLSYNPANTGLTTGLKGRFLFRDQWPSLPVAFKSYYFSADIGDRSLPGAGGLGLVVTSDDPGYGLIRTLSLGLNIAVRVPIQEYLVLQFGIKAGFVQKQVSWTDFTFTDQLDGRLGSIYQTNFTPPDGNRRTAADFGVGGVLQFANPDANLSGSIGLAADHLFQPDISFLMTDNSVLPRKWVINGDLIINAQPKDAYPLKLDIGLLYENQAKLNSITAGLNLVKYGVYLGCWFRDAFGGISPQSSLAVAAGYRLAITDDLGVKFMYSYDIPVSSSLQGTGGAHEVSLIIDMGNLSLFGGGSGREGYIVPMRSRHAGARPLECSEF